MTAVYLSVAALNSSTIPEQFSDILHWLGRHMQVAFDLSLRITDSKCKRNSGFELKSNWRFSKYVFSDIFSENLCQITENILFV